MAKIIPIDVIKGISGKYGNKSSDYFATNRSSNQIHLAKIVNPYQGPPTEKQKAQQAKFAARQVVSTAWLNANRPSETTGEKGTADYQLVQRMKRQMGLSNINQVLHKYMGEDNIIRLPHGDEFQAPPTQDGGGSSAGGTKRRHTEDGLRLRQVERRQHAVRTHPDRQRRPHPHGLLQDGQHGRRHRPRRKHRSGRRRNPRRLTSLPRAYGLTKAGPGDLSSRHKRRKTTIHHFHQRFKKHPLSCQQTRKRPGSLSSRRPSPSSRPSPPAWASRVASQPSECPTLPTRVNHPKRLNHPTAARLATRSSLPTRPNLPKRPNRYRAGPLTPP